VLNDELLTAVAELCGTGVSKLVSCWQHFLRNLYKAYTRYNVSEDAKQEIELMVNDLHRSRSQAMFDALAALIVKWIADNGLPKFAKWLEAFYLTAPWSTWWYMASGVLGVMATNNPLESAWRGEHASMT